MKRRDIVMQIAMIDSALILRISINGKVRVCTHIVQEQFFVVCQLKIQYPPMFINIINRQRLLWWSLRDAMMTHMMCYTTNDALIHPWYK